MAKSIRVIDIFSGAGGLSKGFFDSGFKIISAVEINNKLSQTFKKNFFDTKVFEEDIKKIKSKDLLLKYKEVDVVIGGPPCQGFSMSGYRIRKKNTFLEDPRNVLFREFFRVIKQLKPKVFVMENVQGILSMKKGEVVSEILNCFNSIGYKLSFNTLNSADFGIPQIRKRVFFIGNRLNIDPQLFFPKSTHNPGNYVSIENAIFDLPFTKSGSGKFEMLYDKNPISNYQKLMRSKSKKLYNHDSTAHSQKVIKILKLIKEGCGRDSLPKNLQTKSIHSGAYGRMDRSKPSYTITTRFDTPPVGRVTHPIANRAITAREAARLQSFPDDFVFYGSRSDIGIQIGNSVPPLLAFNIAKIIKRLINGKK